MTKLRALRQFSSTVWGNVDEGQTFEVDEGYVAALISNGMAERLEGDATLATDDATAAAIASLMAPPTRRRSRT